MQALLAWLRFTASGGAILLADEKCQGEQWEVMAEQCHRMPLRKYDLVVVPCGATGAPRANVAALEHIPATTLNDWDNRARRDQWAFLKRTD